jgi:hypothetical protein
MLRISSLLIVMTQAIDQDDPISGRGQPGVLGSDIPRRDPGPPRGPGRLRQAWSLG